MPNWSSHLRGVGARLLIAFFGISAFSALIAGAALYAFVQVGESFQLIDRRVEPTLASLEVSRLAERIVRAQSALSAVTSEAERAGVTKELASEVGELRGFLSELRQGGVAPEALSSIEVNAQQLEENLAKLDAVVDQRLQLIARIKDTMNGIFGTADDIQRLLSPTLMVYQSQAGRLAATLSVQPNVASEDVKPLVAELSAQNVDHETSAVVDMLMQASLSDQTQRLNVLAFQLKRSLGIIEQTAQALDPKLRPLFLAQIEKLQGVSDGPNAIPILRRQEISLVEEAASLLKKNTTLSIGLTSAADELVGASKREIRVAIASAVGVQQLST